MFQKVRMKPNFSKYISLRKKSRLSASPVEGPLPMEMKGERYEQGMSARSAPVVHSPGGNDQLLSFGAGVGVDEMRTHQEDDLSRDIAVRLVLSRRHRSGNEKQDEPGDPDFVEHLEVQNADTRVEFGAHEEVIDGISGKPVSPATNHRLDVDDYAVEEA